MTIIDTLWLIGWIIRTICAIIVTYGSVKYWNWRRVHDEKTIKRWWK